MTDAAAELFASEEKNAGREEKNGINADPDIKRRRAAVKEEAKK